MQKNKLAGFFAEIFLVFEGERAVKVGAAGSRLA